MEKRTVNKNYKRETFNTMIDKDTQKAFSEYCKETGMKMNIVLEYFMKEFVAGNIQLTMVDRRKMQKDIYKKELEKNMNDILNRIHMQYDSEAEFAQIRKELEFIMNN